MLGRLCPVMYRTEGEKREGDGGGETWVCALIGGMALASYRYHSDWRHENSAPKVPKVDDLIW